MNKTGIIFIFVCLPFVLKAQFDPPRLSQYLNNGLSYNPAYAGSREALSATSVYRSVYMGFEGHPKGMFFGIHSPVGKGKVALGGAVEGNSFPGYSNYGIYGNYSYRMWLGSMRLALGLKAGVYNYSMNYSQLDLLNPTDPQFTDDKGFAPNFGAGLYLYNNNFFFGLSVPYFLNTPDSASSFNIDPGAYHYYLTAGYLWDISENFKIKASTLTDYSIGVLDIQGGLNFIMFDDKVWLGGLYRSSSRTITGLLELQLSPPLRLGIAYDYSFTNLSRVSYGSMELLLRYEFKFKADVDSPIYF
jgi:type IX secretion system PorP/SprF family membrane protein